MIHHRDAVQEKTLIEEFLASDRSSFFDDSMNELLSAYLANVLVVCKICKNLLSFTSSVAMIADCQTAVAQNLADLRSAIVVQPLLMPTVLHVINGALLSDFYGAFRVDSKFTNAILTPYLALLDLFINFESGIESLLSSRYEKLEADLSAQLPPEQAEDLTLQLMVQRYQLREKVVKAYEQAIIHHQPKFDLILQDYFKFT